MPAVRSRSVPHPADNPRWLYTYAELAESVGGLSARKIRREVEEGRMRFVQTGEERGRMVEGQQYLDWLGERRSSTAGAQ